MSTKINDGGPAFPWVADDDKKEHLEVQWGLSKREWFAGLAMQGMMCNGFIPTSAYNYPMAAVQIADALIAELEKGTK